MEGEMTACFRGLVAIRLFFSTNSDANVLYRNGPLVMRGSWRWWPSSKIAMNWPSPARFCANPVPASVSVIGSSDVNNFGGGECETKNNQVDITCAFIEMRGVFSAIDLDLTCHRHDGS